jgi:hypothetical protein
MASKLGEAMNFAFDRVCCTPASWLAATALLGPILMLLTMTLNGTFMLFSPRLWFRLPTGIRAWSAAGMGRDNTRFTSEKNGSGIGAVQIRILGCVTLLVTGVIVAAIVGRQTP